MPFSTAHPALVLPLCKLSKKSVSVTALIIGSISPDMEYFFHLRPNRTFGHLYLHAWWFDLVITLVLCFVFHHILKRALIHNLPTFLKARAVSYRSLNWYQHFKEHYFIILLSALIGIYSHLVWDEFTHKGTYMVEHVAWLKVHLFDFFGKSIQVYKVLQHTSSLVGTLIVCYAIFRLERQTTIAINGNWYFYWLKIVLWSIPIAALLFLLKWQNLAFTVFIPLLSSLIICTMTGLLLSWILVSLLHREV
ncbi:MAG: DUF4184 family protein [Bacteroidota bacterium]